MAFELFDESPVDDDIQVVEAGSAADDDIEVVGPTKQTVTPANRGIMGAATSRAKDDEPPPEPARKRRRSERDPADIFSEDYDEDNDPLALLVGQSFDSPEKRRKLTLVYWGLSLVLLSIFLFMGFWALAFVGFLIMLGSGLEEGLGYLGIAIILGLATDSCRIVGYGLCLAMPGKGMSKSWAFIALVMSIGSVCVATFQFFAGMIEAVVLPQVLVILAILLGTMSWISFLLFLESVADVMGERGIADSVSATIKVAGMFCLCLVIGMGSQLGLVLYAQAHGKPNFMEGADPSVLMFDCCHGAFSAFTAILGLVVFIRYVGALINVRRTIEAWL
jgi:hypothetical protein